MSSIEQSAKAGQAVFAAALLLACVLTVPAVPAVAVVEFSAAAKPASVPVEILPLTGPLTDRNAEVSGLTWHEDKLVVMPQDPEYFGQEGRLGFFIIQRSAVEVAIAAKYPLPIEPERVECVAPGMARLIRGFDGLEALGILDDRVYMTVEARDKNRMTSFLVCGQFDATSDRVTIDTAKLASIPLGVNIPNVAEESLLVDGRRILTFSEANGRRCNPEPRAKIFDDEINYVGSIPFPNIEYRVTDATAQDDQGRFWVVNYFFPPEAGKLQVGRDDEIDRFGLPDDQDPRHGVERLLELRLTDDDRIERTDTPPIWLQRRADGECRNWEAVVRLDDRGFLLMTDKYPGTLLGYVPNPYRRTATGSSDHE